MLIIVGKCTSLVEFQCEVAVCKLWCLIFQLNVPDLKNLPLKEETDELVAKFQLGEGDSPGDHRKVSDEFRFISVTQNYLLQPRLLSTSERQRLPTSDLVLHPWKKS